MFVTLNAIAFGHFMKKTFDYTTFNILRRNNFSLQDVVQQFLEIIPVYRKQYIDKHLCLFLKAGSAKNF